MPNPDHGLALRSFARSLERLRVSLGVTKKDFADMLSMSETDYVKARAREKEISAAALDSLASALNLSLEHLRKGTLDYAAVAARFRGDSGYLPERYAYAAFSRRRTTANLLNYLDDFWGWESKHSVLRALQVSEDVFSKPDEKVSLLFVKDVLDQLRGRGFGDEQFFAMGAYGVVSYKDSVIGRELSASRTVKEAYERLTGPGGLCEKYFEKNSQYRLLSLTDHGCTIEALTNPDLAEIVDPRQFASKEICSSKCGVAASVPGYLSLPLSSVIETTCVLRGDRTCRFEVDFEFSDFAWKHRAGGSWFRA